MRWCICIVYGCVCLRGTYCGKCNYTPYYHYATTIYYYYTTIHTTILYHTIPPLLYSEVDHDFYKPQIEAYSNGCWSDMRSFGIIIVQLYSRRCFQDEEYREFKNRDTFTVKQLNEIIYLKRLPATLRRLLEICFKHYEYDEIKIGRSYGVKTVSIQTAFCKDLLKVYHAMKVDVQTLYHDFAPPPPKEPFWTEADEARRIKYVARYVCVCC